MKNFYSAKDNDKIMRRQVRDLEKIFTEDIVDKELLSEYTKNT